MPSLTGFLVWMETDEVEVKRQLDGEGHRIRVMTVHGAKGLEAEIVILPDTADRNPQEKDELYRLPDGPAVWKVGERGKPRPDRGRTRRPQGREAAEENLRLLYVAMTRARCWLVTAAAGKVSQDRLLVQPDPRRGRAAECRRSWTTVSSGTALATGPPRLRADRRGASRRAARLADAPGPRCRCSGPKVLSPSDLGGPKALPGEAVHDLEARPCARGTALHLLLERLPDLTPPTGPPMPPALVADEPRLAAVLLAEARAVLDDPDLLPLFRARHVWPKWPSPAPWRRPAPDRVHRPAGGRPGPGAGRRLQVERRGAPTPTEACPKASCASLAPMPTCWRQIYPDRRIETAILWTKAPRLMPLDPEIVRAALARTTIP